MDTPQPPQDYAITAGTGRAGPGPMIALFGGRLMLTEGIGVVCHGDITLLPEEGRCLEIAGPLMQNLHPLLDGQHTAVELVGHLRGRFSAPEVLELLGALLRKGLVVVADAGGHKFGRERSVTLASSGVEAQMLRTALADQGVEVLPLGAQGPLELRIVDDYFNLSANAPRNSEQDWMPVKLAGDSAWLGPIFRTGKGACPSCLAHRLERTQEAYRLANPRTLRRLPGKAAVAAAQICALQVSRWLGRAQEDDHPLLHALATIDGSVPGAELHPVNRRPQCPDCGSPDAMEPAPIRIGDDAEQPQGLSGKDADEALLERFGHHVDSLTGLVTNLEPVSDHPVNVVRARYVRPIPADTDRRAVENRMLVAAGKGTLVRTARAGALAEALERYSSTWDGSEALTIASANELGKDCVMPNDCMLFSESQLSQGSTGEGMKCRVPEVLDPDAPVGWLKAWSLTSNEWRYVAAGWALMGYGGVGKQFCVGDSNGNAAGWSIEDAIMRGVGELVERDAVALWWYNRVRRRGVCLDAIKPEYIDQLRDHYRNIGRELWVLDLTSDIGLPTFAAVSQCVGGEFAYPAIAFGAHVDAEVAVLRAITEMNQMLPHALAQAPREDRPVPSGGRGDSMSLVSLEGHDYILPDDSSSLCRPDSFACPAGADLTSQIGRIQQGFADAGLEMLVLNHTRPDVGLPVVKVIVPGLRHFWRRLGPGRLYDVPVRMGWCERANTEGEINSLELAI